MLNKSVARRYAEAFFSIARDNQKIDEYQQELTKILGIINEVDGLMDYFSHLLIPSKEKKELAGKIFSGQVSQLTLNFFLTLIDKRREAYIEVIAEEYGMLADESRNISKAELVSAQEVPAAEVEVLAKKISESLGKTVQLKQSIDESLIGGVKIRIGDRIIDATVTKKLEMLKEQLIKAKIS